MEMIKHKIFGTGEVISKETINGFTYLNVRFQGGKEMKFGIPVSFETGMLEAQGELKDEVDKAIAEKKAKLSAPATSSAPAATAKKATTKAMPIGLLPTAFEQYLIGAGYKEKTDKGTPSTVHSYVNAVESVRAEEGISWYTLKKDIADIVRKYDDGGSMSWFGAKSNNTVICALKCYADFVGKP